MRQLLVELTRTPPGIAGKHQRPGSGTRLEHTPQENGRRREKQARHDGAVLDVGRLFSTEDPSAIRFDRSAGVESQIVAVLNGWFEANHSRRRLVGRAIQHETERSLGHEVAQQHNRLGEVWILQLWHREQERGFESFRHDPILSRSYSFLSVRSGRARAAIPSRAFSGQPQTDPSRPGATHRRAPAGSKTDARWP